MLHETAYFSLFVQVLTGLLEVWALQLKISPDVLVLRQALILELIVQVVELMFYVWLVFAIRKSAANITPKRYYDWFLTTPTMLFTLMLYLKYLSQDKPTSLPQFAKDHQETIIKVVILNALMLVFGFLGEVGVLRTRTSVVLGFIPFITYYALIYQEFVSDNPEGQKIYWYFVAVWSLYGVAALMPYATKNASYNILDLFAKNFFGVYLSWLLYMNQMA
jgi:bacteriorhodopsin